MTGLNMKAAESLQVVNYGIGGHYEPHTDYIPHQNAFPGYKGDRIATVLFYVRRLLQCFFFCMNDNL